MILVNLNKSAGVVGFFSLTKGDIKSSLGLGLTLTSYLSELENALLVHKYKICNSLESPL